MVDDTKPLPFIGRERELRHLLDRVSLAVEGRGGIVLLAGEPGIGKTRTAEELSAIAEARGARVLWGRCLESEGAPAYWPWIQILRAQTRGRDADQVRADLRSGAEGITELAPIPWERPVDRGAAPAGVTGPTRYQLFDGYTTFLRRVCAEHPLLLVLDDIHQADISSLRLLEWVARDLESGHLRRDGPKLLILCTFRDPAGGRHNPLVTLLGEMARLTCCERLELPSLSPAETARAIAHSIAMPPEPGLTAAVHATTDGNPFFLVEVLRLLQADGSLGRATSLVSIDVPPTVRQAIVGRLERLSRTARRLLTVASVEGREFRLSVIGRVSGIDGTRLLDLAAEAEAARFITPIPRTIDGFRFVHSLIRETLYSGLPRTARMQLHGQIGDALSNMAAVDPSPHLAELAHHFVQAAAFHRSSEAIAYARRAGDQAMANLAYEEAVRHFGAAIQVIDLQPAGDATVQSEQRCELLLAQAQALSLAGFFEDARRCVFDAAALARRLQASVLLARAALSLAVVVADVGLIDRPAIALLSESLDQIPDGDSAVRARLMASLAKALYAVPSADDRRATLCVEATAMARRLGDPRVLAEVLECVYWSMPAPEQVAERLALADELVALAEAAGAADLAFHGHAERVIEHVALGDMAAVDRDLAAAGRIAAELRQPYYLMSVRGFQAVREAVAGRFDDVERQIALVSDGAEHLPSSVMAFGSVLIRLPLYLERGREPELLTSVDRLLERLADSLLLPLSCVRLLLLSRLGRVDEVADELPRISVLDFHDLPRDHFWLFSLACQAEVCAERGDQPRAAALYDLLSPFAGRTVAAWSIVCIGVVDRVLGLLAAALGRWEAAEQHFERALAMSAAMGARPFLAQTQCDYAAMLLARATADGETALSVDRARALLLASRDTAQDLGMERLAARAACLLHALQTDRAAVPAGLTPREVEVLRLLACRWSNNEIAAGLVLSVRTVERHIANIYTKIGGHTRYEAREYARRAGLIPPD
jgi:DNA-binding CsgD family transcriptional regulator